jgi:hypothetical protein
MSDWKNRPVYEKFTRDIINTIPDDLLAWSMFDHIWLKVGKDYNKISQTLSGLPSGFSVIYHLFVLDGEIGNGGFNQYFFNGLERNVEKQIAALNLIGASSHLMVLRRAFEIHNDEKQNIELQRRYDEHTIEAFFSTYGITQLEKCDGEWYALDKEFKILMSKFIRDHTELFITEK